eukprot:scaffold12515_cov56-Phaeocystis_antarctica.AAC.8
MARRRGPVAAAQPGHRAQAAANTRPGPSRQRASHRRAPCLPEAVSCWAKRRRDPRGPKRTPADSVAGGWPSSSSESSSSACCCSSCARSGGRNAATGPASSSSLDDESAIRVRARRVLGR